MTADWDPVAGARPGAGWHSVGRGLHRPTDVGDADPFMADLRTWALALPPGAAFTHLTAARAHGLWLPPLPEDLPVFVAAPVHGVRPVRPGVRATRHREVAVVLSAGIPLAPVTEAILAAARDLGLLDLVVLLDSVLHLGLATRTDVEQVAAQRRRGAPALRRALHLADGRSESPWESLLRLLHVLCGIEVEPQTCLRDRHGDVVARVDLRLTGTRAAHEYDGADHLGRPQQRRDLARQCRLDGAGYTRRGCTDREVLHQASTILRDADASTGREHRPERVRSWYAELERSLFTPAGTATLRRRWRLTGTGG